MTQILIISLENRRCTAWLYTRERQLPALQRFSRVCVVSGGVSSEEDGKDDAEGRTMMVGYGIAVETRHVLD